MELMYIKPGATFAVGKKSQLNASWDVQRWSFIP